MFQQCNFIKPQTVGCGYTSCIKIGGVPILPPLITWKRRQELEEDRRKAIELENRLKPKLLEQGSLPHPQPKPSAPITRTLANRLTFDSDESHDALATAETPKESDKPTKLPLKNPKVPSKLTRNVFDVSQYSNDGVILFSQRSPASKTSGNLSASMVELDLTSLCCEGDGCGDACHNQSTRGLLLSGLLSPTRPRLLRSNSYTLESPSPVLLEHFKKQAELEKYSGPKRRSLDLTSHDLKSGFNQSVSVCDAGAVFDLFLQGCGRNDEHIDRDTLKGCDIPVGSISSVVEDLAQLHFGAIDAEEMDGAASSKPVESDVQDKDDDVHLRVAEAEAALHEVLNDIPENYARDIMELLERHKLEQEVKLESYAKFKQKLMDDSVNLNGLTLPKYNDSKDSNVEELLEFDPLLSQEQTPKEAASSYDEASKSCTIHCLTNSPTDTMNALNTSTSLIDIESDTEPLIYFDCKSTLCVINSNDSVRSSSRNASCSKELFAERSDKTQRRLKQQWAARVLTAAAKGYLVRRLKRTERVRNLIQTIRDALLCAMSLHTENSEVIQPSDVELHRRLIQQVSAACYEFYDVFFTLTTKEQMALIALDRQRLQEKLNRSSSSSSLKMDSRSASKDQRRSFGARQKKSLTPSFAA